MDSLDHYYFLISKDDLHYKRLDHWLVEKLGVHSRVKIQKWFKDGLITSSNSSTQLALSKMPPIDTEIKVIVPPLPTNELIPQNIPLNILHEDEHLLIIDKPAGLVVHPAPGNWDQTLVNALLYHRPSITGVGSSGRPGIVHRLDKGTSGTMVISKNEQCHRKLSELFASHNLTRKYESYNYGNLLTPANPLTSFIGRDPGNRQRMTITAPDQGKKAITYYKVIRSSSNIHYLEYQLETGRTHQIRVHAKHLLNAPILGDTTYGKELPTSAQYHSLKALLHTHPYPVLHAKVLGFTHPITQENLYFEQPPPAIFQAIHTLLI